MERTARTDDFSHIRLSYITHFYCDQNNIDSVVSLLREYETFAPDLLDCVEFVIVDDGSPVSYEIPRFNLNLRWIKINENIAWNQAGARNLGALYAHSRFGLCAMRRHDALYGFCASLRAVFL